MYYPGGMKVRISHVQSIKPSRILAPTRDSIQGLQGPQSRVETTMLPLHTVKQYYCETMTGKALLPRDVRKYVGWTEPIDESDAWSCGQWERWEENYGKDVYSIKGGVKLLFSSYQVVIVK